MPSQYDIVETFVNLLDLPDCKRRERIYLMVGQLSCFSGWPDMFHGTFGGRIIAIENSLVTTANLESYSTRPS
jgi:hypothetical protein